MRSQAVLPTPLALRSGHCRYTDSVGRYVHAHHPSNGLLRRTAQFEREARGLEIATPSSSAYHLGAHSCTHWARSPAYDMISTLSRVSSVPRRRHAVHSPRSIPSSRPPSRAERSRGAAQAARQPRARASPRGSLCGETVLSLVHLVLSCPP